MKVPEGVYTCVLRLVQLMYIISDGSTLKCTPARSRKGIGFTKIMFLSISFWIEAVSSAGLKGLTRKSKQLVAWIAWAASAA